MKESAPEHIERFCTKDFEDTFYRRLYNKYHADYTFVHKIKCDCGEMKFKVYKDDHPSVILKCDCCNRDIVAYDLSYYPAATKVNINYNKKLIQFDKLKCFSVYTIYQYDDEFELEYDVEFNKNVISWGIIYIKNGDFVKKILDDETT